MTLTTTPDPAASPAVDAERTSTPRHYLMCPPTFFDVVYAINPWMDPSSAVDTSLAVAQWERLKETYEAYGHRVEVVEPVPGLPDMVYAANGGAVVGGRALASRFVHAERRAEGPAYEAWFGGPGTDIGLSSLGQAVELNEGQGDFLLAGDVLLAGTGFRTSLAAHGEAARRLDIEVVTLELVDPRYYHLDTALCVLDDGAVSGERTLAWYPPAFSRRSQEVVRSLFPDATVATDDDAAVLGLNAVSDGRHVFLTDRALRLHELLRERGFEPVGVDLSELLKGGGSVKCCTLELDLP